MEELIIPLKIKLQATSVNAVKKSLLLMLPQKARVFAASGLTLD
jgi:hypothetical protein